MVARVVFLLCLVGCVGHANALCIVNRSQDTVVFVRGEPYAGMETYFTGSIRSGAQHCSRLSPRSDGTYPVSVYGISKRGACALVKGCYYESHAEQVFFPGQIQHHVQSHFRTTHVIKPGLNRLSFAVDSRPREAVQV